VTTPTDDLKSCCARAYQHDAVALILGDSFHPGGLAMTRHLGHVLGLRPGQRVLDIASGPGTSAFCLAGEFGVTVDGVELGEVAVAAANAKAAELGLAERAHFLLADAERLPLPDRRVDAVICECAFCTFPDKAAAAAEMVRVLNAGGQVGITDVTLDPARLDPELASLAGWVACLADARPLAGYANLLEQAGLHVTRIERHDHTLAEMIETIDARLVAFGMVGLPGVDIDAARAKVALARQAVTDGVAGYSLLVASRS
jgi:arsenite methyltransferase